MASKRKRFKPIHCACVVFYYRRIARKAEAGGGGIPLRKIEVPCSDDVADSRLRIVGLIVRLPKTSVAT